MTEEQITIERVRVLNGHTNPDTAYLVDDYPYGSLRCKRRTWVETATKGKAKGQQRFVAQTTDPRRLGEVWNKPHAWQYHSFVAMFLDEQDHVSYWSDGLWVTPAGDARMRLMGIYDQLTDEDRARYDLQVKLSQRPGIAATSWRAWEEAIHALAGHVRETGTDPTVTGKVWQGPARSYHLGDDVAPYIVTARNRVLGVSNPGQS